MMGLVESVRAIVTQIEHLDGGRVNVTYTSLAGTAQRVDQMAARNAPGLGEEFSFADDGTGRLLGEPRALPPTDAAFAAWIVLRMGRENFESEPGSVQMLVREAFVAGRASR